MYHPTRETDFTNQKRFRKSFLEGASHAFVVAVDIRRSTDLMLKARTPRHFAEFTTALCVELTQVLLESGGVFDKFTGDGILAFFSNFTVVRIQRIAQ